MMMMTMMIGGQTELEESMMCFWLPYTIMNETLIDTRIHFPTYLGSSFYLLSTS